MEFCARGFHRPRRGYRGRTGSVSASSFPITHPITHLGLTIFCLTLCVGKVLAQAKSSSDNGEVTNAIKTWAMKFGTDISAAHTVSSNYSEIKQKFESLNAEVKSNNPQLMFEQMLTQLGDLITKRQNAVEHLYKEMEKIAENHTYEPKGYQFVNSKRLDTSKKGRFPDDEGDTFIALELNYSSLFGQQANFLNSAVHVATNIYTKADPVMRAIQMSAKLDSRFRNNREDPYLSYQFFCSATGFLRLHPAIQWPEMDPDMYECRTRQWYVQAAASAKDVVILLDISGSMTGLRKEIARNVVINILETLSDNDFVQILKFNDEVRPLVPCFEQPVQANQRNIREFKESLICLDTVNIANFSAALTEAFDLLQKFNRSKVGSQCNQAIMLITDGAPYNYEDIFRRYNWPNIPIRVFTYLIGREVTDTREVNWMACANRGYYTHVTTLAEVREQVLKYIPVMSRPIALANKHPVIWTAAYPTVTETLLTDNLWEERERARHRAIAMANIDRRNKGSNNVQPRSLDDEDYESDDYDEDYSAQEVEPTDQADVYTTTRRRRRRDTGPSGIDGRSPAEHRDFAEHKKKKLQLLTTVAMPVFTLGEPKGENQTNTTAQLLGVVGIDVPVREFEKLTSPFKMGVNAYSFIMNKNGHLISHPDLRPMFQDMVKPYHGNVDLLEVELLDNETAARDFPSAFLTLRKNMIDGRRGWTERHLVRIHMDGMKRVATRRNKYHYGPIPNSVFSLAVALPQPYGAYQVEAQVDLMTREDEWKKYFPDNGDWNVHPNWTYCEDKRGDDIPSKANTGFEPQKKVIQNFLRRTRLDSQNEVGYKKSGQGKIKFNDIECDKELIESLIFDAKATFPDPSTTKQDESRNKKREATNRNSGIIRAFVATRSGLTRVQTIDQKSEDNFTMKYPRSIDELFYKRAVDFYQISPNSFVYSVPYDSGARDAADIVITASRAIFLGSGEKQAPAAVVGVQINHTSFTEKFMNVTNSCEGGNCNFKCSEDSLDCYLLDNNGFIIVAANRTNVGKFFGEVDSILFQEMVKRNLYKKIRIYDYQSICFDARQPSGPASTLRNPIAAILKSFLWFVNYLFSSFTRLSSLGHEWLEVYAGDSPEYSDGTESPHYGLKKTRPRPCDKEIDLYEMQPMDDKPLKAMLPKCGEEGCVKDFFVQAVKESNLVLLAITRACPMCEPLIQPLVTQEVNSTEINATSSAIACTTVALPRQRPDQCYNYHAAFGRPYNTSEPICPDGYHAIYEKGRRA